MNVIRTISLPDYFGTITTFGIIWETVCMGYTFAVGIDGNKTNEFSIFYIWNNGFQDCYQILDTGFLDVYAKYGYSIEEKVKKEMKKIIIQGLTKRFQSGMITLEQIERLA